MVYMVETDGGRKVIKGSELIATHAAALKLVIGDEPIASEADVGGGEVFFTLYSGETASVVQKAA